MCREFCFGGYNKVSEAIADTYFKRYLTLEDKKTRDVAPDIRFARWLHDLLNELITCDMVRDKLPSVQHIYDMIVRDETLMEYGYERNCIVQLVRCLHVDRHQSLELALNMIYCTMEKDLRDTFFRLHVVMNDGSVLEYGSLKDNEK